MVALIVLTIAQVSLYAKNPYEKIDYAIQEIPDDFESADLLDYITKDKEIHPTGITIKSVKKADIKDKGVKIHIKYMADKIKYYAHTAYKAYENAVKELKKLQKKLNSHYQDLDNAYKAKKKAVQEAKKLEETINKLKSIPEADLCIGILEERLDAAEITLSNKKKT